MRDEAIQSFWIARDCRGLRPLQRTGGSFHSLAMTKGLSVLRACSADSAVNLDSRFRGNDAEQRRPHPTNAAILSAT